MWLCAAAADMIEELSVELDQDERKYRLDAFETLVAEGVKLKADLDEWKRRAETAQGWISVKDRLPEDGEDVVVIARTGIPYWYRVAYLKRRRWMRDNGQRIYDTVTHWMPLPEPPKEVYHGQS